jgi:O-antigen/teichoic acid export membrane protein
VLNLAGAVTAAVVSFVTVGVVANNYGQAGAGLFFSATAAFTLAANGARLGGESGLTFFVSRLRAAGDNGGLKPLIATAAGATALAAAVLAGIGYALAPELSDLLTTDAGNVTELATMIRILAVAVPAFALSQVLFGASRGFGTMRPAVVSGQIVRPVAQLLFVLVAVAASTEIWPLAVAWAAASLVAAIPVALWLRARLHRGRHPRVAFRAGEYWRFAAPRAVTDLVSSALERSDVLLVAYFLSEADVGLYGVSNRLILAGQLMMYATAQSMAPHLSASFLQGRHDDARKLLNTIVGWNVTLLWPLLITLAFGAETVLGLFGEGFAEGAGVVRVLALSLALVIGLGIGDTLLLMTGDSVASLLNHVVALVALVALSALLLPQIGLVGAAWAWAVSRLLIRGLAVARVWQTTRVHVFGRALGVAVGLATVSFVPTGLVARQLFGDGPLALLVHVAAGSLIHLALVFRFRHVLELEQLMQVLARRSGALQPPGGRS